MFITIISVFGVWLLICFIIFYFSIRCPYCHGFYRIKVGSGSLPICAYYNDFICNKCGLMWRNIHEC